MRAGDRVRCKRSADYNGLTEGKEYVLTGYQPEERDATFTWPAYAEVVGDDGRTLVCHASRFEVIP